MDSHNFLALLLIYLGAAVFAVLVSKRLGLGSVLGYLAAGSLIGPWGTGLISDVQSIMHFAEFGVVLLLFLIGLELQPEKLWSLRKMVFGLGSLQVFFTAILVGGFAFSLKLPMASAFVIGVGLSLSSTAFALQILTERNLLNTQFGKLSFAILLFQDLAVIPILAILPLLSSEAIGGTTPTILSFLVVIAISVGGRFILRPVFRLIARASSKEIFTAASLFLVLGMAYWMQKLGLSMALGAFIAGVLLADSEYRHELEADIEPFKGLLLGLFFVSVGMSIDCQLIAQKPLWVFGLVLGLVLIKSLVLYFLGRFSQLGNTASRAMAFTLSQGGEFAFVLFGIARAQHLLESTTADYLTLTVALSMAMTPVLLALGESLTKRLSPTVAKKFDEIRNEDNPVIIAGYGRVGQMPGRLLRMHGIGYTALEHDSEQVNVVRRFGQKIYYGDASRLDLLEAAGAKKAKVFILAIDDLEASLRTAQVVKQHFPNLKILARARNRQHAYELMDLGIQVIYRETFASSLEMARDALVELGFKRNEAVETIAKFREHDEKNLIEQHKLHKNQEELISFSKRAVDQLAEQFRSDKKGD